MYKALRSFNVVDKQGNTRRVKPGDPVPEAEGWRNRKSYVEGRWICLEDDEPSPHYSEKIKGPKAAEPVSEPEAETDSEPDPTVDLPEETPELETVVIPVLPGDDEADQIVSRLTQPEPEPEPAEPEGVLQSLPTQAELEAMSVAELKKVARKMDDVKVDQKKADLLAAIIAAQ